MCVFTFDKRLIETLFLVFNILVGEKLQTISKKMVNEKQTVNEAAPADAEADQVEAEGDDEEEEDIEMIDDGSEANGECKLFTIFWRLSLPNSFLV